MADWVRLRLGDEGRAGGGHGFPSVAHSMFCSGVSPLTPHCQSQWLLLDNSELARIWAIMIRECFRAAWCDPLGKSKHRRKPLENLKNHDQNFLIHNICVNCWISAHALLQLFLFFFKMALGSGALSFQKSWSDFVHRKSFVRRLVGAQLLAFDNDLAGWMAFYFLVLGKLGSFLHCLSPSAEENDPFFC